jgi:hypothetical protein
MTEHIQQLWLPYAKSMSIYLSETHIYKIDVFNLKPSQEHDQKKTNIHKVSPKALQHINSRAPNVNCITAK